MQFVSYYSPIISRKTPFSYELAFKLTSDLVISVPWPSVVFDLVSSGTESSEECFSSAIFLAGGLGNLSEDALFLAKFASNL